jgi:AraC-like DNA-binding protein
VISDIINYISAQATTPLRIDAICRRFYISRAQLNRKFRERTGLSVWEYITNKRLLLAQNLLQTGETPAVVSAKVGFNNYTTFYRAYRKKFGVPPKADHRWK